MFYHPNILKRGGRFYVCWLADSWPQQFQRNPPRTLRAYPVAQLSTELLQIIENETESTNRRFALRLSSRLVHGLVLIYKKQADLLLSDILHLDSNVRKQIKNKHKRAEKRKITELYEHELPIPTELELAKISNQNTVGNIQDITLREEFILPTTVPNEGFGDEVFPNQEALMPEAILTGLDASLVNVTGIHENLIDTIDMTKLKTTLTDIQMEALEKACSLVDTTRVLDVPTLPEILITSHIDKDKTIDDANASLKTVVPGVIRRQRKMLDDLSEQMSLEPVTTPLPKRRKRRTLIIDNDIKLSTLTMENNVKKINIEQRCKTAADDIMKLDRMFLPNPMELFNNPAHNRFKPNNSSLLTKMFKRNAITNSEPDMKKIRAPKEREIVREKKIDDSLKTSFISESIMEQSMNVHNATLAHIQENPEIEQPSPLGMAQLSIQDTSIPTINDLSIGKCLDEIMTLAEYNETSKTTAAMKRVSEKTMKGSPKKVSKLDTAAKAKNAHEIVVQADVHVEPNVQCDINEPVAVSKSIEDPNRDSDEMGQGSLDRTLVSLGDNSPTSSYKILQEYLDDFWEPTGLFKKILDAKRDGIRPINLGTIVNNNYCESTNLSRRMIMARAFNSLLRLKKHGLVEIIKKPGTCEILHIKVGPRAKAYV